MWLFALLVAVPILEIALFIQVGGAIGLWPTLSIVVATALVGTILLRGQGLATLANLQSSIREQRNPVTPIAHGAIILVAGVLLLTPGFFTDAMGLLFLLPPVRKFIIKGVSERLKTRAQVYTSTMHSREHPRQEPDGVVIDGEFTIDETAEPGNSGWTKRPD
jgi:UPF0716 protein FxsA